MSDEWQKVLDATDKHTIERVIFTFASDARGGWGYLHCSCGATLEDDWEYADHIRRLVFDALRPEAIEGRSLLNSVLHAESEDG